MTTRDKWTLLNFPYERILRDYSRGINSGVANILSSRRVVKKIRVHYLRAYAILALCDRASERMHFKTILSSSHRGKTTSRGSRGRAIPLKTSLVLPWVFCETCSKVGDSNVPANKFRRQGGRIVLSFGNNSLPLLSQTRIILLKLAKEKAKIATIKSIYYVYICSSTLR